MNFNKRLRFDDAYNDNNDDHDDEPQQLEDLLDDCGETLSSTLPVPTADDIVITIPDTDDELDEAELCYIDESDSEEDDESAINEELLSSSGVAWKHHTTNQCGRQPSRNIVRFTEGPATGIRPESEMEAFLMLMEKPLEIAIRFTNLQGRRVASVWNRNHPDNVKVFHPVDITEIHAFVGLLIIMGKIIYYYSFIYSA